MKNIVKIQVTKRPNRLTISISASDKEKLQQFANNNTNGNTSMAIALIINNRPALSKTEPTMQIRSRKKTITLTDDHREKLIDLAARHTNGNHSMLISLLINSVKNKKMK